ncbi:hypothetical protein ABPG72_017136 [Tetrahymena utriculariae]
MEEIRSDHISENSLDSSNKSSKKRDYKQYSQSSEAEEFTLGELQERNKFKLYSERIYQNDSINQAHSNISKNELTSFPPIKIRQNEQQDNQSKKKLTDFYMNQLVHHKNLKKNKHFINFRSLFYEDPFYKEKNTRPKKTLISAFLTTKGLDEELVLPLVKANVKVVVADDKIKQWNEKRNVIKNHQYFENFTIIYPPKDYLSKTWGCFHSKLWILKFPKFLRIVIGTGNLRILHWTNWSNIIWFKDFELVPQQIQISQSLDYFNSNLSMGSKGVKVINLEKNYRNINDVDMNDDFIDVLNEFIDKICPYFDVKEMLDIHLRSYEIKGIDFMLVSSLPGKYSGSQIHEYGKMRIRKICQVFNPRNIYSKKVLYSQSTSLGTIDRTFVNEFLFCFLPYQFCSEVELKDKVKKNDPEKNDEIRLIFPSKDYIINKTLDGAGYSDTLFLTSKRYQKESFLKNIFYQFQCKQMDSLGESQDKQKGIIPHFKTMIVCEQNGEINDDTVIYIGSHNFSEAAWGKLNKDNSQLYISNTELGILVPPMKGSKELKEEIVEIMNYKFPAKQYREKEKPYISDIDHPIFKK